MLVLGIETSCDETAAAVVEGGGRVLSDVVHSQVAMHAPYGGVVPELASRDHLRNAHPVIVKALSDAAVGIEDVSGIAVTCRPGLTGALLVGVQIARGLAWSSGKPVVGIDHLIGHICASFLRRPDVLPVEPPGLPFVALVASGGHTALYRVDALRSDGIRELGATRDDAAGEAFDKVAKLLGLGYPGGPVIDRLAKGGDPTRIAIAPPMPERDSLEFSFSGIKTSVARWVEKNGASMDEAVLADVCASFQRRVVDVLVRKTIVAARREGISTIVIGGGVAANRELREAMSRAGAVRELRVVLPPISSCTDNAAMIALAGAVRLEQGEDDTGGLEVSPRTLLPRVTRKGRGRRGRS